METEGNPSRQLRDPGTSPLNECVYEIDRLNKIGAPLSGVTAACAGLRRLAGL